MGGFMRTPAPRYAILAAALTTASVVLLSTPVRAMDLNSFRAQHHRPPLSASATLSGLAYEQAQAMAGRSHLDHNGFRQRVGATGGGVHAENVAVGCADEDCAYRMWARSSGHRANMLRGDVSAYGLASATGSNGRKYWALELGN
jgi:uncharacterized protein YkwD